jgi:hypothetical protein
MKAFTTCACCGGKIHASENELSWAVVTAQNADGHDRDMYFVSNSDEKIRLFAAAVKPKMIYSSYYSTLREAVEFVDEYLDGYDEIDPVTRH